MNRVLAGICAILIVAVAAAFSSQKSGSENRPAESSATIRAESEAKNPWTGLTPNADPEQFQFAIVSDRTGGHRSKIFARAVRQINLLQPAFVLSVGDLIEGYTLKPETMTAEWKEFNGFVNQLEMPFFYVPGNHDLSNKEMNEDWKERFGRKYYHFVYKNVLFLAVNSEDEKPGQITAAQTEYFKKVLADNKNVRWVLSFMHTPLWTANDLEKNGWKAFENELAGRKYTVFCGHIHRYQKFVRNGMNYYQLATTGGGSRLRGVDYGEFDQVCWVTMKNDGPRLANIALEGVFPENLTIPIPENDEVVPARKLGPVVSVNGRVTLAGKPLAGATVAFWRTVKVKAVGDKPETERTFVVCDGFTDLEGNFQMSTNGKFDGAPPGEYSVTIVRAESGKYADPETGKTNTLPLKYAQPKTSGLKATVRQDDKNVYKFELE